MKALKIILIILAILLALVILLTAAVAAICYKPYMLKQRLTELKTNEDIGFFDQYHKEARDALQEELQESLKITLEKNFLRVYEINLHKPEQFKGQVSCKAFIVICTSKKDAALLLESVEKLSKEYDEFACSQDGNIVFWGEKYLLQFFGQ